MSRQLFQHRLCLNLENKISLENIKKIEIIGVDWVGLRNTNYLLSYNYENGLSNGIENYLLIEYNNNTNQKIQFQQNDACEFEEIEEVIKHYYTNNKIGYLNCVDILCLSEKKQRNEFKISIFGFFKLCFVFTN